MKALPFVVLSWLMAAAIFWFVASYVDVVLNNLNGCVYAWWNLFAWFF